MDVSAKEGRGMSAGGGGRRVNTPKIEVESILSLSLTGGVDRYGRERGRSGASVGERGAAPASHRSDCFSVRATRAGVAARSSL